MFPIRYKYCAISLMKLLEGYSLDQHQTTLVDANVEKISTELRKS